METKRINTDKPDCICEGKRGDLMKAKEVGLEGGWLFCANRLVCTKKGFR